MNVHSWEYLIGGPAIIDLPPYEHRADCIREIIEDQTGHVLGWEQIEIIRSHVRLNVIAELNK